MRSRAASEVLPELNQPEPAPAPPAPAPPAAPPPPPAPEHLVAKARRQSQILQAEKLAAALEAAEKETELMPESDGEQLFEDVEE